MLNADEFHQIVDKVKMAEESALLGGQITKNLLNFIRPSEGGFRRLKIRDSFDAAMGLIQYKIPLEEIDLKNNLTGNEPFISGDKNLLAEHQADASTRWTISHKEAGKERSFDQYDYVLASQRFASCVASTWVERRSTAPGAPDGRFLSFTDWGTGGDLAIHDLATGQNRRLTDRRNLPAGSSGVAQYSVPSPDGKSVAYAWNGNTYDLCVIGLDGLHPLGPQAVAELDQAGGFQEDGRLKSFKSTEALPISVFVKFFDRPLIRAVESVLQDMQPDHEANRLSGSAQGAVVLGKGFLQAVPIDQLCGPQELMVRVQSTCKSQLKHGQLPFRGLKRHNSTPVKGQLIKR
jgi:hypothetical protein